MQDAYKDTNVIGRCQIVALFLCATLRLVLIVWNCHLDFVQVEVAHVVYKTLIDPTMTEHWVQICIPVYDDEDGPRGCGGCEEVFFAVEDMISQFSVEFGSYDFGRTAFGSSYDRDHCHGNHNRE